MKGAPFLVMLSPSGGCRCERFGHRIVKECVGRAGTAGLGGGGGALVLKTARQAARQERSCLLRQGSPIRGCLRDDMIVM